MYSIDDHPPEVALAAIKLAREAIKWRKQEIAQAIELMTNRSENTTKAVNIGKIVEKIVPSFSSFAHHLGDCRALFEPIDYVIFPGLASRGHVDSLLFVDVKSGKAQLSKDQKAIRSAIEEGAVNFGVIDDTRSK
jgi:predicted Holliday junction resolvase-like endonuclease